VKELKYIWHLERDQEYIACVKCLMENLDLEANAVTSEFIDLVR